MTMFFTLPFIHIFMLGYIVTGFIAFGKYFLYCFGSNLQSSCSLKTKGSGIFRSEYAGKGG